MTSYPPDAVRQNTIQYLTHRLLIERGWPLSGNIGDYIARATDLFDGGLSDIAFGSPIPEAVLKFRNSTIEN